MSARRRLLDDLSRVATGAAGVLQGAGREAEMLFRQRLERLLDGMDLPTREEFEAVKAMAAEARADNERLAARVAALEAAVKPSPPPRKPAARRRKAAAAKE